MRKNLLIRNSARHAALAFSMLTYGASAQTSGYHPPNGFVPDEKAAVKIAEAVLSPIYGEQQIFNERPFHAKLDSKGVWTVRGTLPSGTKGGVAIIQINRIDAKIIYLMHGK